MLLPTGTLRGLRRPWDLWPRLLPRPPLRRAPTAIRPKSHNQSAVKRTWACTATAARPPAALSWTPPLGSSQRLLFLSCLAQF